MKKIFTFWSMALMVLALGFSQNAQAPTWIVAGEPAEAFHGSYWDPSDTQNQMVLQKQKYREYQKHLQYVDSP